MIMPVNQMSRNATEPIMARRGFCRGFVDSLATTATASQPAYRTAQVTPALASPRMPPMLLASEKSDTDGRVAPPAWLASWIRARITNEMTDAYSMMIREVCTTTEGRRPRIEIHSPYPAFPSAAAAGGVGGDQLQQVGRDLAVEEGLAAEQERVAADVGEGYNGVLPQDLDGRRHSLGHQVARDVLDCPPRATPAPRRNQRSLPRTRTW